MGHNNIDKEVKKKLESRLLEPNSMAWDKLEGLLDEAEKKEKKPFSSYLVAASMILFLGVFWVFKNLNNDILLKQSKEVVEQNHQQEENKEVKVVEENSFIEVELNKERVTTELVESKATEVKKANSKKKLKQYLKEENKKLPTVYDINIEPIKEEENSLVASNNINVKDNNLIIEVDSLLANAKTSIAKSEEAEEIAKPKVVYTVDADALLADVEEELDLSFKEKVFKKIKQGFKKTKTAVAKRND